MLRWLGDTTATDFDTTSGRQDDVHHVDFTQFVEYPPRLLIVILILTDSN